MDVAAAGAADGAAALSDGSLMLMGVAPLLVALAAELLLGSGAVGGRWRGEGRRYPLEASREGICGRPPRGDGGRLPPVPGRGEASLLPERPLPVRGELERSPPGRGDESRVPPRGEPERILTIPSRQPQAVGRCSGLCV